MNRFTMLTNEIFCEFANEEYSHRDALLWMLCNATQAQESKFIYNGTAICAKRGQLYRSYDQLRGEFKWKSKNKVSKFLKNLNDMGIITQDTDKSLIQFCEYNKYVSAPINAENGNGNINRLKSFIDNNLESQNMVQNEALGYDEGTMKRQQRDSKETAKRQQRDYTISNKIKDNKKKVQMPTSLSGEDKREVGKSSSQDQDQDQKKNNLSDDDKNRLTEIYRFYNSRVPANKVLTPFFLSSDKKLESWAIRHHGYIITQLETLDLSDNFNLATYISHIYEESKEMTIFTFDEIVESLKHNYLQDKKQFCAVRDKYPHLLHFLEHVNDNPNKVDRHIHLDYLEFDYRFEFDVFEDQEEEYDEYNNILDSFDV